MSVTRSAVKTSLLLLALAAVGAGRAEGQLTVRFEPRPDGQLATGSSDDLNNGICTKQAFSPRIEVLWSGTREDLRRAYGKPASWILVRFHLLVDGTETRCSTPDGSCRMDISSSHASELEPGLFLLGREMPAVRRDQIPRAFTTGQHVLGFSAPSLGLGTTTTYTLQCEGDTPVPPPTPPPAAALPDYTIGWEAPAKGVGAKGVVADGRTRLGLRARLPGVRQLSIETRLGRFEDREGNPLGATIQTTGGEEADTIWYRPPEYPPGGWGGSVTAVAELAPPKLPGAWTAPRMLRDSITLRFRNARGEEVVRGGGLWVLPTPILMVHGFTGDTATWSTLRPKLAMEGYGSRADNYYNTVNGNNGILAQARYLQSVIADEIGRYRESGFMAGRVDLLAHSMGGLILRAYAYTDLYRDDVRKAVMMGTPNHGIEGSMDRAVGEVATWWFGHGDLQNDVHPTSMIMRTLNGDEFDGTRNHLGPIQEWGNIYALGTDRVVSDWSAPLNGAQFLELPVGERTGHSNAVLNDWFKVGILESQTTVNQLKRWLSAPIPPGPLDTWHVRVLPEFDEDGTLLGDLDPTAWTSSRHWASRPSDILLSRDRVRTERGRAKIRWYRNDKAFAEIVMEEGTDIMIHGQSRRRVSVTLRSGRALFSSKGDGEGKGAVNVIVEPAAGGAHRRWDLRTRGTIFAVEVMPDAPPRVTVLEGEVDVVDATATSEEVLGTVAPGEQVALDASGSQLPQQASGGGWWDATGTWGGAAGLPEVWTSDAAVHSADTGTQPSGGASVTPENAYALDAYPADFAALAGRITARANQGFTPVGLAVYGGQVHVLYLGGGVMPITGWQMDSYGSTAELQGGITRRMNEGYLPNGLAWSDGRYFVLFVLTDFTGSAWQIVTSAMDLQAVKQDIDPWLRQDYVPFDVTLAEGRYLTLLVQLSDKISETWSIEGAQPSGVKALIEGQFGAGFIPWGLLVDQVANVLFLGG